MSYAAIRVGGIDEEVEQRDRSLALCITNRISDLSSRNKFVSGIVIGVTCCVVLICMSANTVKVVHRRLPHRMLRNEMKTAADSMRTQRISGTAYTPYECGATDSVFCCKAKGNHKLDRRLFDSIKWYTTECDSFEDGWTCCYYSD